MVNYFYKLDELRFAELMQVYQEGNRENADEQYSRMDRNAALLRAEQDFYAYLSDVFFRTEGALYAVWEENGQYVSALRMEPYQDGMLLAALETRPDLRRKGFAKKLMNAVLNDISCKVYSHVNKNNTASISAHLSSGFQIISDTAVYIDGSSAPWCFTLYHEGKIL